MSRERCEQKRNYYFAELDYIDVGYCDANFGVDRDEGANVIVDVKENGDISKHEKQS